MIFASLKTAETMKSKKVLFITQEMVPYVPNSGMALDGRSLPQGFCEQGCEIRTFMPRWGLVNERRNQLHEVIRLSGMNIIIDDTDHPLIIKVASIQAARMQVYFIDNEDYFHKRGMIADDNGKEYDDNAERAIFYARGVLETVKKLRWCPDIVYCQGWMSSVVPFYIKTAYSDEPAFSGVKIVSAIYGQSPSISESPRFSERLFFRGANAEALGQAGIELGSMTCLEQLGVAFSDGVAEGEPGVRPEIFDYAKSMGKPVLSAPDKDGMVNAYGDYFDSILG